jgi:hypothetical protein
MRMNQTFTVFRMSVKLLMIRKLSCLLALSRCNAEGKHWTSHFTFKGGGPTILVPSAASLVCRIYKDIPKVDFF